MKFGTVRHTFAGSQAYTYRHKRTGERYRLVACTTTGEVYEHCGTGMLVKFAMFARELNLATGG